MAKKKSTPKKKKKKELSWGGARAGAGRPQKYSTPAKQVAVVMPAAAIDVIDKLASQASMNRSEFVLDSLRRQHAQLRRVLKPR